MWRRLLFRKICYDRFMRQKSTDIVEGQDFHRQFQDSPDERKMSKYINSEFSQKDKKQGQGKFRVEKKVKKK